MKRVLLFLVRSYKAVLSPLLGRHCRYYPTCSEYMAQAIEKYGLIRGAGLGLKRLLRCHPFHAGGLDPLP